MNTTEIIRSTMYKENPFTRIPNSIGKLKAEEIGIMFHMLSNSDTWVINKDDILRKSKLGKTRFTKAWNHLKELGYIVVTRLPGKNGQFNHHYTIFEMPEVQNQSTAIDKPSNDHRTTETHTTVTGGTNNYYITNTKEEAGTGIVSNGLATEWRGRHDQKEIGPNMLGQEKTNEDILQIVPPPSLCFGSVRDNKEAHEEYIKVTDSQLEEPFDIISSEEWYPKHLNVSDEEREVIEDLKNLPLDFLTDMLDAEYLEKLPNWEELLQNKYQSTHTFLKETSKLHKPDIVAIETLTEYNIRIKRAKY